MIRITLVAPIYSVIPLGSGLTFLWLSFIILNTLRFTGCLSWEFVGIAPVQAVQVINNNENKIYLQMQNGVVYCNSNSQWEACSLPAYPWAKETAPAWLTQSFSLPSNQNVPIQDLSRILPPKEVRYYALLHNKEIWQCNTTFANEVIYITHSWKIILLLIPSLLSIFFGIWFVKIFLKEGYPVLWNMWTGRGEVIK